MLGLAATLAFQIASVPYTYRNVEIGGGGFVTGIITHPVARDLVYARTDIGGAYRWNPRTRRWIPLMDFITRPDWNLYGVESLAVDPQDPNRVYVAAGTYTNQWGGNGAMLLSDDQGVTWTRVDMPFRMGGNMEGRSMGERLQVDPNDGRILVFASRNNGSWRSTDRGITWRPMALPVFDPPNGYGVAWITFDPKSGVKGSPTPVLYAGVPRMTPNLYRSGDGGATWTPISGVKLPDMWPHQGKIKPDGSLVVTYSNAQGPNDIANGAVIRYDPATNRTVDITPERPAEGNTFGYGGITFDPRQPKTMLVSTLCRWSKGDTVFRTTDGGVTWSDLKAISQHDASSAPYLKWGRPQVEFGHWIGDVEVDPHNPNRAWYVTGATIWSTDNLRAPRIEWSPRAQGLEETAVIDLTSPPAGAYVVSALGDIAGFAHDHFDRSPPGGMWTNPLWNTTDDVDYAYARPERVVRVGRGQGAYSTDGGHTWTPFAEPQSDPIRGGASVAISADGTTILWSINNGPVFRSFTAGKTWQEVQFAGGRVIADRVDPNRFYMANARTGETWFSDDRGISFRPGPSIGSGNGHPVPVITRDGHVWIPTDTGLMRSTNGGNTYIRVDTPARVEQIAFGKSRRAWGYPTAYIIGEVNGVAGFFRSEDEGRTWQRINDSRTGFGTAQVIEADPRIFGRFYLGTNGRGIIVGDPR